MLSERQAVELFHLCFLRLLCAGADRDDFALKGGCNLRFFFDSARYSEDLDLDVARVPPHTLRQRVSKLLDGQPLALTLRSRGLSVAEWSAPKQTDTTQRWKMSLAVDGWALALHTKVEFSRRVTTEEAEVAPVVGAVLAEHQLMTLLLPHYPLAPALRQKVGALVGRSAVQARDVFDLAVLLARTGGSLDALAPISTQLPKAIERAMDVSFDDYTSQVVSYLKPEHAGEYGSRQAWNALQIQVVEALERAAP
jgi:predicted nucleotidyltransferase component of viral defense system